MMLFSPHFSHFRKVSKSARPRSPDAPVIATEHPFVEEIWDATVDAMQIYFLFPYLGVAI